MAPLEDTKCRSCYQIYRFFIVLQSNLRAVMNQITNASGVLFSSAFLVLSSANDSNIISDVLLRQLHGTVGYSEKCIDYTIVADSSSCLLQL